MNEWLETAGGNPAMSDADKQRQVQICPTCVDYHGRDTTRYIVCEHCGKRFCVWHQSSKYMRHIRIANGEKSPEENDER